MQRFKLTRCHPLYLVIVVVVGLTVFNSVLYEPQLGDGRVFPIAAYTDQKVKSAADVSIAWSNLKQAAAGGKHPCEDMNVNRLVQAVLDGAVLCPGSKGYKESVTIFNTALRVMPKIVFRPVNERDVTVAMMLAVKYGLVVTVKNGGHNPAGFSLNQGGMVVDMKHMKKVFWSNEPDNALHAQGGARWSDVHGVIKERGRSIVGGGCPQVGVTGLALGGGVGWTSRYRGLVSDNLLAARIVFPNGTLTAIDSKDNSELLWALRGGGGSNFGVVTEVVLKTFPAEKKYFAGSFCFDRHPDSFKDIIEVLQSMINGEFDLDDRLTMDLFMNRVPPTEDINESPATVRKESGMFDGPILDAVSTSKMLLNQIAELVTDVHACGLIKGLCDTQSSVLLAVANIRAWVRQGGPWKQGHTFTSWSRSFGVDYLDVYWKSFMADKFTDGMVDNTVALFRDIPKVRKNSGAHIVVQIAFEHLGGQMQKNNRQFSAWKHGNGKVMGSIQSYIVNPSTFRKRFTSEHVEVLSYLSNWTETIHSAMLPHSQGSYSNYADGDLKDWPERYFGGDIFSHLQRIKKNIPGAYEMFAGDQRIFMDESSDVSQMQETVAGSGSLKSFKVQNTSLGLEGLGNGDESSTLEGYENHNDPQRISKLPDHTSISDDKGGPHGRNASLVDALAVNASTISFSYPFSKNCPQSMKQTVVPVAESQIPAGIESTKTEEISGADASQDKSIVTTRNMMEAISSDDILEEKSILLTGGSRGIGWSAVLHLMNLGASIVYTSQSQTGCDLSYQKMRAVVDARGMPGKISCVPLALDDFGSVHSFTSRVGSKIFDTVILNAGTFETVFGLATKAGNSTKMLATNHLGHFLLVHELLEAGMINTSFGRIIVTSSFAADRAMHAGIARLLAIPPVPYLELLGNETLVGSEALNAYIAAKGVSVVFAMELAERIKSSGKQIVVAVSLPSGTADTNLTAIVLSNPRFRKEILTEDVTISTQEGALGSVYLSSALAKEAEIQAWKQGKAAFVSSCTSVDKHLSQLDTADLRCLVWVTSLVMTGLDKQPIPEGSVLGAFLRLC